MQSRGVILVLTYHSLLFLVIASAQPKQTEIRFRPLRGRTYDAGPLALCTKPHISGCVFSSDYRIPAYKSATLPKAIGTAMRDFLDILSFVTTDDCVGAIRGLLCRLAANPRCVGNSSARFFTNFTESCLVALASSCPMSQRSALEERICFDREFTSDPILSIDSSSDYSLTTCKRFRNPLCASTGMSPAWIIASEEARILAAQDAGGGAVGDAQSYECAKSYFKFLCSLPICEKNRMLFRQTRKRCYDVLGSCNGNVFADLEERLQCDAYDKSVVRYEWESWTTMAPTDLLTANTTNATNSTTYATMPSKAGKSFNINTAVIVIVMLSLSIR